MCRSHTEGASEGHCVNSAPRHDEKKRKKKNAASQNHLYSYILSPLYTLEYT